MKIYTKTGDNGQTGLMGGTRVSKDDLRITAIGDIDELNAVLGLCRAHNRTKYLELEKILHQLQRELFDLGADLSTPLKEKYQVPRVTDGQIQQLEHWIDEIDQKVEPLKHFILPEGSLLASHLHLARTVCRRVERNIVALQKKAEIGDKILIYVNRLSDLLFMMARYANHLEKREEEKWDPGSS
jgi:cob(I)alamin adenosyltransferase